MSLSLWWSRPVWEGEGEREGELPSPELFCCSGRVVLSLVDLWEGREKREDGRREGGGREGKGGKREGGGRERGREEGGKEGGRKEGRRRKGERRREERKERGGREGRGRREEEGGEEKEVYKSYNLHGWRGDRHTYPEGKNFDSSSGSIVSSLRSSR